MHVNELLESVFRTGSGVFAVDEEQRVIFWNQGAEAILGYTPEEVMGKSCVEVIKGVSESGQVACTLDCAVPNQGRQDELSCGSNIRVKNKNGLWRWLSMTHAFADLDSCHVAVVHIFRDATPEVEAKMLLGRIRNQISGYGLLQGAEDGRNGLDTDLTERETQVLELLARGEGTDSVAKKLTISNTTARNHVQNILAKLGVHTRLEAVAFALRHGLIKPE